MSISRLAGVLLAFAVLALPARADEAADRLAAAREAIEASGAVATMTAVLPAIVQQVSDLIVQTRPEAEEAMKVIGPKMVEIFSGRAADMSDDAAKLYAEAFTLTELRAMTTFYRSPEGQAVVRKLPQVSQQLLVLGNEWGKRLGQDVLDAARDELEKRGIKL